MSWCFLLKYFYDLGEQRLYDTLRFWTMSIAEFLDEYFESDVIKASLAGSGIIGTALGPYSPGTAYVLLHHYMGEVDGTIGAWGFARGGMGAISQALGDCLESHGGEIRTDAEVQKVLVKHGRANGVVLANGDEIHASNVVSNMDVKRTFLKTFDANDLPDEFVEQVRRFKIRGSSGKVNIALDGLPEFPHLPKDCPAKEGDVHFTDSMERIERAYDDWKAGTWSKDPYLDVVIPTQIDPTMAPPGKHFMSIFVQYAPPFLKNAEWDDENRKAFGETVVNQIAAYSPNFKDLILHMEVRSPQDLENEVGLTEGNIFQGELTFDQLLFNRPVPGYAQYRAPVKGMYMCGSSSHPRRRGDGCTGIQCCPGDPTRRRQSDGGLEPGVNDYDIAIIGGGHNGLVCSAYLARAGQRVIVLEAASEVGGAAITREIAPGYRVSGCAHLFHLFNKRVWDDLNLERSGLSFSQSNISTTSLSTSGHHLTLLGGTNGMQSSLAAHSPDDVERLSRFRTQFGRFAGALEPLLTMTPPRLATDDWGDRSALMKLGWRLRRLGQSDMREYLRIVALNVADLVEDTFESELLRGVIAFDAVLGTHLGPRSPNSVLTLLYRLMGESDDGLAHPAGGMGAVTTALAETATGNGVEIRTDAAVSQVLVGDDKAQGVELESGERISTRLVVSSTDPKRTFLSLLGTEHLDTGFVRRINNLRMRGSVAKLNLALDGLPTFEGVAPDAMTGRLLIAPDVDYVENAFNHAKYGEYSPAPALEITIPSTHDPSLAPEGKHVLSALIQYAPYHLKTDWEEGKPEFEQAVMQTLSRYAGGIEDLIVAKQLLTPLDLEREFRLTGGHWHHGELVFDQFAMLRPAPGYAQYATPMSGLYLCGAGSHPGGGVMGAAGFNAAQRIIAREIGE